MTLPCWFYGHRWWMVEKEEKFEYNVSPNPVKHVYINRIPLEFCDRCGTPNKNYKRLMGVR